MDPVGGSIPVFHPIFQPQGIPSVPEPFPPSSTSQMRFFFHEKSWKTLCPKAQVSPIPAGNKSQIPAPPPFPHGGSRENPAGFWRSWDLGRNSGGISDPGKTGAATLGMQRAKAAMNPWNSSLFSWKTSREREFAGREFPKMRSRNSQSHKRIPGIC